ncbi:MAG: hypothetical protein LBC14_08780 [Desulfovibrio sp.]|nr:hypothetical protein [Desulfovibrio sp.]
MPPSEREKIHYELLEALYKARKQVEQLEAAVAHNAAFLGIGVEREDRLGRPAPDRADLPDAVMRYLGLVGHVEDISDYIGGEGHAESRPHLGRDAPETIRPADGPRIDRLVGNVVLDHPDDGLLLGAGTPEPQDLTGNIGASPQTPPETSGLRR